MARTREVDKEKNREYQRKWYAANKEKQYERTRANQARVVAETRPMLLEYLKEHPCMDCGYSDIRALEFDHVRGTKKKGVTKLVSMGLSWESIMKEIDKCDVVCSNCHKIRTYSRMDTCYRNDQ